MNKTIASTLVIAFATLAGGQAMAANIDPTTGVDYDALRIAMATPSKVTREQVKAELLADRAAHKGDVFDTITGVNLTQLRVVMATPSKVTREQVKAELLADRATHKGDVFDPISGVNLTQLRADMAQPIVKTRQEVREEAVRARQAAAASVAVNVEI